MYSQSLPRSTGASRQEMAVVHSSPGPSKVGVRTNPTAGHGHAVMLSPGRTRRTARTTSSNQSSRSGSPLTIPMESLQSVNAAYSMSGSYLGDGVGSHGSATPSPSSRSPYQSPAHSRSSSMTSVKSLLRDRGDRGDRDHLHGHGHHGHSHERKGALVRDRSLDRQLDRHHRDMDKHHTYGGRDRSLDREYPHMGARSLERDYHMHSSLVRSRSIDHEYLANQASYLSALTASQDLRHSRETLVLDLQGQIAELNKECAAMQQELDATKEKLSSSMNSIKTFWSPELKKERVLRKEESAKFGALHEQLKLAMSEKKKSESQLRQLEDDLRYVKGSPRNAIGSPESGTLKKEKEKQAKEIMILRKTIEEMELRINTQKQTLGARDESIRKLLEMLQSKGLTVRQLEDDHIEADRLRARVLEEERRGRQLEVLLETRDKEIGMLKEDLHRSTNEARVVQAQLDKTKQATHGQEALHSLVESKDARIAALEKEVRLVEEELLRIREESSSSSREAKDNTVQLQALRSQERLLKAKLENAQAEVSRRDSDVAALRTQMETLERQGSDHVQHIGVLREQISAKEQQVSMLQADIEILRSRLREKDAAIEKKGKSVLAVAAERKRAEGDLAELRDHLDIKDRKINVLNRKIENLEDLLKDKEAQLQAAKARLASLHADQSSSDSALSGLEETLSDKEKQIERLKEQRERTDREHQEEVDRYQRTGKELQGRSETLQAELDEKQHEVLELRDEVSSLKSERVKRDSQTSEFQRQLSQKTAEIEQLSNKLKKEEDEHLAEAQRNIAEVKRLRTSADVESADYKDQVVKTQAEVDRLLDILKEVEDEKNVKDKQIKDLQETMKDLKSKVGQMKRTQQTEKKKSAQLLEEARKREDNVSEDASQLKSVIKERGERIEELEEALRESVKITAQREMIMAQQQMKMDETEKQIQNFKEKIKELDESTSKYDQQVALLTCELDEKQGRLKTLQTERNKQLEEVYEMKQEAILAAISEKDAHLALLEMGNSPRKNNDEVARLTYEKDKLQKQLKELTQNRMKLLNSEHNGHAANDSSISKKIQGAPTNEMIQAIRRFEHSKKRLRSLIDQLVAICLETDAQLLEGLPRLQQDHAVPSQQLRTMDRQDLLLVLMNCEEDSGRLQDYANILLQRIRTACPDRLHYIMQWLDQAIH